MHTAMATCVQVRRKNRYVSESFRRRKDGEGWKLDMERNIDRQAKWILKGIHFSRLIVLGARPEVDFLRFG
jgi:hypothetical protein